MKIKQYTAWLQNRPDTMLDLIRMYLGVALFFKGIFFISHHDQLLQILDKAGTWAIAPGTILHYIIPIHLVGGLLLALGLLTRVAALAQLPILLGAVFYAHLPELSMMNLESRLSFELSALVLFLTCVICVYGSGRLSLDHVMKGARHHTPAVPRAA